MKRYNILLSFFCGALLSMSSCTDYLDISPESGISEEQVYTEYYAYKGVVDRGNWLVTNYTAGHTNWGAYQGAISDEQQALKVGHPVWKTVNQGLWQNSRWRDFGLYSQSETGYGDNPYLNAPAGKSVKAIRAMGLAIQNIERLVDFPAEAGYTKEELKSQLLGQAYALRAWHYFEVIKRYGPMLLVDTDNGGRDPFPTEFDFDRERPTWHECADLIAADCDEAIKYLPTKWKLAVDEGRLTKLSAMSIKAMTYLFAASPLMNTEGGSLPWGKDSYNEEYAKKGIAAYCEAIKLYEGGSTRYMMYPKEDYMENWMSQNGAISDEAIFQPVNSNGNGWCMPMNRGGQGSGWMLPSHDGGWAIFNMPTQNAVDRFETINGYPVSKFASNDPDFDPKKPYENRDPRLHQFIFCPGDEMYMSAPAKAPMENQAWATDADGGQGYHYKHYRNQGFVYTGYFEAGKWRKIGYNKYDNKYSQNYYRFYPLIRVPDLYLGLAELANEVYGPLGAIAEASGISVNNAAAAVNVVRKRVDMPNVRAEFTANADAFRERVRNEYAVEFYGEFRRWFDIRRWRIAKDVLAGGIYAADVTKKADGTFSYAAKKLDVPRVFEDKHYWYPFHTSYTDLFVTFEQNPGW